MISGTSDITFDARGTEGRACQFGTDRDRGVGLLGTAVGSGPTATAARAYESWTSAQGSMLVAAAQRSSGRDTDRRCGSRAAAQRQGHSRSIDLQIDDLWELLLQILDEGGMHGGGTCARYRTSQDASVGGPEDDSGARGSRTAASARCQVGRRDAEASADLWPAPCAFIPPQSAVQVQSSSVSRRSSDNSVGRIVC